MVEDNLKNLKLNIFPYTKRLRYAAPPAPAPPAPPQKKRHRINNNRGTTTALRKNQKTKNCNYIKNQKP